LENNVVPCAKLNWDNGYPSIGCNQKLITTWTRMLHGPWRWKCCSRSACEGKMYWIILIWNVCISLQLKISNETHQISYQLCFLKGFWIKGFGWTLIFAENYHVHHFHPKSRVESLCKNHVFSTFHYHPICLFCSIILLWWIWSTGFSLDFTFTQEGIKLFKHKLINSLHNHEIFIFIPILFPIKMHCILWICQTFFLWPSKDKYFFFLKKLPMNVTKYCTTPCDHIVFIGPHTYICTHPQSSKAFIVPSLRIIFDVFFPCVFYTWCKGASFKFMPFTILSNSLRLTILTFVSKHSTIIWQPCQFYFYFSKSWY